jgi:hypothetical protein
MNQTKYITSKINQQLYCKSNGQFTRHLHKHKLTYKDYYEIYETYFTPLCLCLKPLSFYQKTESYANSCGDPICVGKNISLTKQNWTTKQRQIDSEHKQKAAARRTPEQIQAQIEKTSKTFQEKYGVKWATQSDEYKEKSKKTKLERYGNEYYAGWEKSAEKNRNKTIKEQDEINDKRRQTNLERFGVENVFLLPNNKSKVNKGNSSIKKYILPSGKIIGIRGYEHIVLDQLLQTYNETDLQVHDDLSDYVIERFEYQSVDRKRLYYPDIYISKENLIIAVKSEWWWNGKLDLRYKSRLENNLRKRQAVIDNGYRFQLWLFDNKYTYRILENASDFQREQEKFKSIDA